MNHRANVSLVDTHAKRNRSHHNIDLTLLKSALNALAYRRVKPGMIRRSANDARKLFRQQFRLLARLRVNNRRLSRSIFQKFRNNRRPHRHRHFHNLNRQVVTPKAMNKLRRSSHSKLRNNVSLHGRRSRRRQRQHRRSLPFAIASPQLRQSLAQHAVIRPKIMAPLRNTVRLINSNQRKRALRQHLRKSGNPQPLRSNKKELKIAIEIVRTRLPRSSAVHAGMNPRHLEPKRNELRSLVFHQRNQRRNHQRGTAASKRGKLIAQALARARRHHQQ